MQTSLLFALLLFTTTVFSQETHSGAKEFVTTSRNNYSITHPASWAIDTSKTMGMDLFLFSPKTDSLDDFRENINVMFMNLAGMNYTLERMGKESEAQMDKYLTDLVIIESKIYSSATIPYYRLALKGRQGKFSLTTIQHYYLNNDVGYAVTLTLVKGEEEKFRAIGEKILSSFKPQ